MGPIGQASSPTALPERKRALRHELLSARDALTDRAERSAAICRQVIALELFAAAPTIHCFLPIRSEVDPKPIIDAALAAGKAVAIPITTRTGPLRHAWIESCDPEGFEPGIFGTLRPKRIVEALPNTWALTITPLLAFDRAGYRLGYGKGYYDQLLSQTTGAAIGVAFAMQEREALPREAHDVPLALIVTEYEVIRRPEDLKHSS